MGFPKIKKVHTIQLDKCEKIDFDEIVTSTKDTVKKSNDIDKFIDDLKTQKPEFKNLKKKQIIRVSKCNAQVKTKNRTNKIPNIESVTAICPNGYLTSDPTGKVIKEGLPLTEENIEKVGRVTKKKAPFYKEIRQVSYENDKPEEMCTVAFSYKDENNILKYKVIETQKLFAQNRFKKKK
jgi:hypothetical protein